MAEYETCVSEPLGGWAQACSKQKVLRRPRKVCDDEQVRMLEGRDSEGAACNAETMRDKGCTNPSTD